jgi:hypothetical protein
MTRDELLDAVEQVTAALGAVDRTRAAVDGGGDMSDTIADLEMALEQLRVRRCGVLRDGADGWRATLTTEEGDSRDGDAPDLVGALRAAVEAVVALRSEELAALSRRGVL